MRYVLIRDDATVADIDEALDALRRKRALTRLDIIRAWITTDVDELLALRLRRTKVPGEVAASRGVAD